MTQAGEDLVNYLKSINGPFSGGESMKDVKQRMRNFFDYLKHEYDNKFISIMSHKAPQLALEVILNGKTWEQAINEDWRQSKAWQPVWFYNLSF